MLQTWFSITHLIDILLLLQYQYILRVQVQCRVPCLVPVVEGCPPPPGLSGLSAQLACWCWWFPSELVVLSSAHKDKTCHLTLQILDCFLNSLVNVCSSITTTASYTCGFNREENFTGIITSGGMCPRCIWPIVICCWGDGMVPMLSDSVPTEPERITPGSATEPCSTRPIRLNCCWRMVDLQIWWCKTLVYPVQNIAVKMSSKKKEITKRAHFWLLAVRIRAFVTVHKAERYWKVFAMCTSGRQRFVLFFCR